LRALSILLFILDDDNCTYVLYNKSSSSDGSSEVLTGGCLGMLSGHLTWFSGACS
jgi:hypothetical protein